MSRPDFVQETMDFLDSNWNTGNAPKPTIIDGDEMRRYNGTRAKSDTPLEDTLLTVDSGPTTQNEPIGTEFQFRVQAGCGIKIEGYHQDGGGPLADKDAFDSIVSEARRALMVDRVYPVGSFLYMTLEDENDRSGEDAMAANYFHYAFDVIYHGYEDLP